MNFSFHEISLATERLVLRTLKPEDATQQYANWLNDPEVNKYLETKEGTLESVQTYIAAKQKQSDALFFGIFLRDGGAHIGTIKLEPIDIAAKKATIAIMIGEKSAWGKGYGPEAMGALIRHAFTALKLREINLGVIAGNVNAIHAYEKVGFREVGRKEAPVPNRSLLQYSITMMVTPESFLGNTL